MLEFLAADENLPFTVSLAIMIILAMLEGVGMLLGAGLSSLIDGLLPDFDVDIDAPDVDAPGVFSHVLGWLYIGKVPFLVVFILLLTSFGVIGLMLQSVVSEVMGALLPGWIAAIVAFSGALPVSRGSAGFVARVMPHDETEAVSSRSFIGRIATITVGTARRGYPAQARLSDEHGQTHYVMVEPDKHQPDFEQGTQVLLVKKKGHAFVAIANENPVLVDE